jgi:transcriptional regulator with XRE-family HTH domain
MFKRYYLRDLRDKHQYTCEDVSEYAMISFNYYLLIEQGKRGIRMSLVTAKKIADAFKISLDEFFEYEHEYLQKHQLIQE